MRKGQVRQRGTTRRCVSGGPPMPAHIAANSGALSDPKIPDLSATINPPPGYLLFVIYVVRPGSLRPPLWIRYRLAAQTGFSFLPGANFLSRRRRKLERSGEMSHSLSGSFWYIGTLVNKMSQVLSPLYSKVCPTRRLFSVTRRSISSVVEGLLSLGDEGSEIWLRVLIT